MRLFNVAQRRLLAVTSVLLTLLPSCGERVDEIDGHVMNAQPVVQVGNAWIAAQDLIYRQGIASAYGTKLEPAPAMVALINLALAGEVAKSVGVSPARADLESFAKHTKKNSKAPELLASVEKLFGTDKFSFYRLYLAPKVINRKLRHWFSRDANMHQKQRMMMQQVWVKVHAGEGFEAVAKVGDVNFSKQNYGKKKAVTPDALKAYFPTGMASMSEGFKALLQATKPGAIVASIAENDHSYRIVRLISQEGDIYQTEEISLAKASFDDWYQEQIKHIHIEIVDVSLKQEIQARYSNIKWVKGLDL